MSTCLPKNKEPILRLRTRPNDANKSGDIFGGWLMSQIDIAGAVAATKCSRGPVVTVAVQSLTFIKPLFVYDLVSFYAEITKIGNTSMHVTVEVFAQDPDEIYDETNVTKISEAKLVYVAVSEPGKPRVIQK